MPDVMALPLNDAVKILAAAGWDFELVRISSRYRDKEIENSYMEEYVVRQRKLSDYKVLLTTMLKRRKEVLEHGFQN